MAKGERKLKKALGNVNTAAFFDILKTLVISIILAVAGTMIFALIAKAAALSENGITVGNIVIKITAILLGCLIGIKKPKLGWLKGFFAGILFILVTYLIFSAIYGQFGRLTPYDVLAGAFAGIFSGIIAVNMKKS